jgi:hypothetical protein
MKRERLVWITRCHLVESVLSQYCGWQSRAGVVSFLKFREPYTVETAACRHANKTRMLMISKKSYAVQMDVIKSYSDFTKGSLDLQHNCQVGTHTHEGVVLVRQVTQAVVEVSVRIEWARVNEVSGMITTTSGLTAPVTDRSMMDTQDGTYVWEYSQEDCVKASCSCTWAVSRCCPTQARLMPAAWSSWKAVRRTRWLGWS